MKRLIALAAMTLTLAACTSTGQPVAQLSATPSVSAEPTGKGLPSATPPTTLDLRVSVFADSCKLPISIAAGGQGAFLTFPEAEVALAGKAGGYYDAAFSRWLPVPRAAVAPDGRHYATVELGDGRTFTIHVVDVATGKETLLRESGDAGFNFPPDVLDYEAEGIYLDNAFEHRQAGLWLADPATGAIKQLSNTWIPVAIDHGYVWVEVLNPADPKPVNTASSAGILPDEIDRVDLKTGDRVTWIYRPGTGLSIVGFDTSGLPLIVAGGWGLDLNAMLLSVKDPATALDVFQGDLAQTFAGGIGDAHGVWLGSSQGIYVYSAADGLRKVSSQPGMPANGCL